MNKVILMGRLTRDPDVRCTQRNSSQEQTCIARYTLAVDQRFNLQNALKRVGISAKEALSAFEALYKVREPERSNNWRKYHGLPLKRRGGKRSGRKKGNDRTTKNTDVS